MKRLLYISMLLFAALFAACDDGLEVGKVDLGYLELVSSNVDFDYRSGTGRIIVDTEHEVTPVKAEDGSATWIRDISVDKNVVSVTVDENIELKYRNTFITLVAGDRRVVVPVSQGIGLLKLGASTMSFNSLPTSSRLVDNRTFSFSPVGSDILSASVNANWITSVKLNRETGIATIEATGNTTTTPRTGEINFVFGKQTAKITVTQEAAAIFTNLTSLTFSHEASSQEVAFDIPDSNGDVTASSNQTWATVRVNNATKIATVTVEASTRTSARTATVTIRYGSMIKNVSVTQTPPPPPPPAN